MHLVQIVISLYLQKDKHEEATSSLASAINMGSGNIEMSDASPSSQSSASTSLDADRIDDFAGMYGKFSVPNILFIQANSYTF